MLDKKLGKKSEAMSRSAKLAEVAVIEKSEKPVLKRIEGETKKKAGVASKKLKKVG